MNNKHESHLESKPFWYCKVKTFWKDHKIMYCRQKQGRWRFRKILWPSQNIRTLQNTCTCYIWFLFNLGLMVLQEDFFYKSNEYNKRQKLLHLCLHAQVIAWPLEGAIYEIQLFFKVYTPPVRHYKQRFVYFLPHFSLRFIIESR